MFYILQLLVMESIAVKATVRDPICATVQTVIPRHPLDAEEVAMVSKALVKYPKTVTKRDPKVVAKDPKAVTKATIKVMAIRKAQVRIVTK